MELKATVGIIMKCAAVYLRNSSIQEVQEILNGSIKFDLPDNSLKRL